MPIYSFLSFFLLQGVCYLHPLQGSVHMQTLQADCGIGHAPKTKPTVLEGSYKRLFGPLIHSTPMVFMSAGPQCVAEFTTWRQMDDSKPGEGSSQCATCMLGLHTYAKVVYRSASNASNKHVCQASLGACISPPYQGQAVGEVGHLLTWKFHEVSRFALVKF